MIDTILGAGIITVNNTTGLSSWGLCFALHREVALGGGTRRKSSGAPTMTESCIPERRALRAQTGCLRSARLSPELALLLKLLD